MISRIVNQAILGRVLGGLGLAVSVAACTAALRTATPNDLPAASTRWPGTTLEDLGRGRASYVAKCSGCHTLYMPEFHSAGDWPDSVKSMAERSRLTETDETDILRFLVTLSGR